MRGTKNVPRGVYNSQVNKIIGLAARLMTLKMMKLLSVLTLGLAASVDAKVVSLTADNFSKEMSGKNGFVKFLAPW